ncbi:hypothetical protein FHU33_2245 [Blastococcus colisei]|uniref:Uncharacterized protein n=2 Tax=Blastococcus colisei TaxID=1564162 RepID=A0A543PFK8_9ACTN|nr:hypothetical protein FHU33_2245 [Blastococcus colisei]
MTVPPLFGWEEIATVLVLLVALGVAFLVVATTRAGAAERSEWQAWLDARSSRGQDPPTVPRDWRRRGLAPVGRQETDAVPNPGAARRRRDPDG